MRWRGATRAKADRVHESSKQPALPYQFSPTKRYWRDPSRLDDIMIGLNALVAEIRRLDLHSLAVPAPGCGNGGLDWAGGRSRMEAALANVQVLVYEPSCPAQDA